MKPCIADVRLLCEIHIVNNKIDKENIHLKYLKIRMSIISRFFRIDSSSNLVNPMYKILIIIFKIDLFIRNKPSGVNF